MYPGRFEYFAPATLDEALSTLDRLGEGAKVLAGGQSLIPLMKLRFASPPALVDINRVPGLDGLREEGGELQIGALVRHRDCERSELLRGRFGVLGDAAPQISDPIVRNLGTVAGSLAHADPQGDWASALMAADARVVVRKPGASREIAVEDFIQGPFTTALEENEVITEVRVPDPGPKAAGTYLKLERKVGDFATVGVATIVRLAPDGTINSSGIGITGVADTPFAATDAEKVLDGQKPSDDLFRKAGEAAAAMSRPVGDVRGPADYKRAMTAEMTLRSLRKAVERALAYA